MLTTIAITISPMPIKTTTTRNQISPESLKPIIKRQEIRESNSTNYQSPTTTTTMSILPISVLQKPYLTLHTNQTITQSLNPFNQTIQRGNPTIRNVAAIDISQGLPHVFLDSRADANFIPPQLSTQGKVAPLDKPIIATTATNKRHAITHRVEFTITQPFHLKFSAYVLPGVKRIILDKPTLRHLQYQIIPHAEFITLAGKRYNCSLKRFANSISISVSSISTLNHESLLTAIKTKYPSLTDTTPRKPKNRALQIRHHNNHHYTSDFKTIFHQCPR